MAEAMQRSEQGAAAVGGSTAMSPFRGSGLSFVRRMMEDMDRLFEELALGIAPRTGLMPTQLISDNPLFSPQIDVLQKEGKLLVRADLPGMRPEDVQVHVDENGLVIAGERKTEKEEKREGYVHMERSWGSFERRIPLPAGVNLDKCEAQFRDGVLEVSVELPREHRKRVDVKTTGAAPQQVQPSGGAGREVRGAEAGQGQGRNGTVNAPR